MGDRELSTIEETRALSGAVHRELRSCAGWLGPFSIAQLVFHVTMISLYHEDAVVWTGLLAVVSWIWLALFPLKLKCHEPHEKDGCIIDDMMLGATFFVNQHPSIEKWLGRFHEVHGTSDFTSKDDKYLKSPPVMSISRINRWMEASILYWA